MRKKLYFVTAFLLLSVPLAAQIAPSAGGTGITIWVGASLFTFNPDYGCADNSPFSCGEHQIIGVAPYVDTSSFMFRRIGLEGEARMGLFHGPVTLIENSYLGGPRVRIFRYRDLSFSGKFLLGQGHLDVPAPALGGGNYFVYAPGAIFESRVAKYVNVRVEYEYQRWPGFKCFQCSNSGSGGLTPNGFGFGVSYAIHTSNSGEPRN